VSGARTKFSQWGSRAVLTAAGLLIIGTAFSNIMVLVVAIFLLLYLLVEATVFHHAVSIAKQYMTVETTPQKIKCTVGRKVEVDSIVANRSNSNLRIIGLSRNTQPHLDKQEVLVETTSLAKEGNFSIRTQLEPKLPGQFEIPALVISLASRLNMFTQSILVPDSATVIARPPIAPLKLASIDSSFLGDLTSDNLRRGSGTGTDLAGIKPSTILDDLHKIDWKATARTGKLMVKELYLERQPGVMLLIDTSRTMTATGKEQSTFTELLAAFPNLLASLRPPTPVGLIQYDENSIIANISPRVGEYQRELVFQTILNGTGPATISRVTLPHEIVSGKNTTAITSVARHRRTSDSFLALISSFYRDVETRRRERLSAQGAFRAFTEVSDFESFLVIAVTDGKTNLDGHIEGAKNAATSGHKVILVLLTDYPKTVTSFLFSELSDIGVKMLECSPEELPTIIAAEIDSIAKERFIPYRTMRRL
jgi:hypothetical protein